MSDPIVVTGIGLVTPIGVGIDAVWEAWVAGRSGIRALAEGDSRCVANVDPSPLPELARAGYVCGFTPRDHVKTSYLRRMDWCSRMLVAAALERGKVGGKRLGVADHGFDGDRGPGQRRIDRRGCTWDH